MKWYPKLNNILCHLHIQKSKYYSQNFEGNQCCKIPKYISRWDIPDISWVQKCYVREGCNSKSLEFAMLWEYEKIAYESTLYQIILLHGLFL